MKAPQYDTRLRNAHAQEDKQRLVDLITDLSARHPELGTKAIAHGVKAVREARGISLENIPNDVGAKLLFDEAFTEYVESARVREIIEQGTT